MQANFNDITKQKIRSGQDKKVFIQINNEEDIFDR